LPLISSLTGPGVAATRFFAAFFSWAIDSSAVATSAEAATAAPEPLRKSRRLKPAALRGCPVPPGLVPADSAPDELLVSRMEAPLAQEMSAKRSSVQAIASFNRVIVQVFVPATTMCTIFFWDDALEVFILHSPFSIFHSSFVVEK
jgi:hypothetical protein